MIRWLAGFAIAFATGCSFTFNTNENDFACGAGGPCDASVSMFQRADAVDANDSSDRGPAPDAAVDMAPDLGTISMDALPFDAGEDADPLDVGEDAGPLDVGEDAGSLDVGEDAGSLDATIIDSGEPAHPALDFGGAWGYINNGALSPNPATNAASCPSGYTAQYLSGTTNLDWPVEICTRPHEAGVSETAFDFGGMWGFVSRAAVANPITQAQSCPAGYTQQPLLNTSNLDLPLYICYQPHVSGTVPQYSFDGAWGYINNGNLVANPLTNAASCPGWSQPGTKVHGTVNVDWTVFFCWH